MTYIDHVLPKNTPQTEPVSDKQVENSAGGFSFGLDTFDRLKRFLILGCEGGTYYASERKITKENAKCVKDAIALDYVRAVDTIVGISVEGRAIKNDPAIFALAVAASDSRSSAKALMHVSEVCRIGTHLFQFVNAVNELRGWGRGLRRAVSDWYLNQSPERLSMQVTKYAQREGWSHRDVLRLAHPQATDPKMDRVLQYVTQRGKFMETLPGLDFLAAVEEAKVVTSATSIVSLIHEYKLVREHIPTQFLNEPSVWNALLCNMPATAMLRNLGKMTSIGLLSPLSKSSRIVTERLTDEEFVLRGRLHPFSILLALATYKTGKGFRGSLSWKPNATITSALDTAFYSSFGSLTPTNKRFLLGIDVSGSMSWGINNTNVNCATAAACMAMVALRTEPQAYAFGFCRNFVDLGLTAADSLGTVLNKTGGLPFGSTNCALPMQHALKHSLPVDVFCVYTDNETYAGSVHPHVALQEYRKIMGIDAKLIVFGMESNGFSIADPDDSGMLDVVGFDSAAPKIVEEFVK